MKTKIKVGIVGVTGMTGHELIKILLRHKKVEVGLLLDEVSQAGTVYKIETDGKKFEKNILSAIDEQTFTHCCNEIDVLILCLPHIVSMKFVKKIYDFIHRLPSTIYHLPRIIDLSGDFRIKNISLYEKFYGEKHQCPELVKNFVYGLPEINKEKIKKSEFISNPGCFPTTVILGLAPILSAKNHKNTIAPVKEIIIDSKSGYSGGGRKLVEQYEGYGGDNTYAYNVSGGHRHIPEIEEQLKMIQEHHSTKSSVKIMFTPHVVPQYQGMFSTIYVKTQNSKFKIQNLIEKYKKFYNDEPFIKILEEGQLPQTKNVIKTNYCEIGFAKQERYSSNWITIFVAIDNLIKGAVGQAVQNLNLMFGIKETEGLM